MRILYLITLIFFVNTTSALGQPPINKSTKYTYKIIESLNNTYGYDIYVDNKLLIHQPAIPALASNEGFKTKNDAIKVAQLVITKIKKGDMPPTIAVEEIKKMKIIKSNLHP
ncbi:MAG TPA: DUF4907 domain-containing protein [Chitinophagaceae bacterium]|nr:DUF4907 domain-containing protein [Chitinophagaceae bacterium]